MASDRKNSFLLYFELREQIGDLSDEQVGKLLRGVLDYEIDRIVPEFEDLELRMAFKFVKVSLDVNRQKYEEKCEKARQSRNQGYEKYKQQAEKQTNSFYPERPSVPDLGKDYHGFE